MKVLSELTYGFKKGKRIMLPMLIVFIIFYGCFGFPLKYSNISDFFWYNVLPYCVVVLMFASIYEGKIIRIFAMTYFFNLLGILLHYILEFGEQSITTDFTITNIIIYLVAVPILIAFGSMTLNKFKLKFLIDP